MTHIPTRPYIGHYPDPHLFLSLFKVRGDTFTEQQPDGSYIRSFRRPSVDEDLIGHWNRSKVIALYPSHNGRCYLGAIDIDIPHDRVADPEEWKKLEENAQKIIEVTEALEIKAFLLEKTGGRGMHIWFFCELVSIYQMNDLLSKILRIAGVAGEIFPLDTFEMGLGKPIRPPLGTHLKYPGSVSKILDPHTFEPIEFTDEVLNYLIKNLMTVKFFEEHGFEKPESSSDAVDHEGIDYTEIPTPESFDALLQELRYCTREIYKAGTVTSGGQGWDIMTSIGSELLANGATQEMVHQYFSAQEGHYNKSRTDSEINKIRKKKLYPTGCKKLQVKCSNYVTQYCGECPSVKREKRDKLKEDLIKTVDRKQNKEERKDGDIKDTLKQFDHIGVEVEDIFSGDRHLLMTNSFNGGNTWSAITHIKRLGRDAPDFTKARVNYVVPLNSIRDQLIGRLTKCKISFLDNPSTVNLCPRAAEFTKLGYVPAIVCRSCPVRGGDRVDTLEVPLREDYYERFDYSDNPFMGTVKFYNQVAVENQTCPKWVYYTYLLRLVDEPLVSIMTPSKLNTHLFIDNSPLVKSLKASLNVIDQIDFIDRYVPRTDISMDLVSKYLRELNIMGEPNQISVIEEDLKELLDGRDIDNRILAKIKMVDYIKKYLYVEKKTRDGIFRRLYHTDRPRDFIYDFMGKKPINFVLKNDILNRHRPDLDTDLIDYLKNMVIDPYRGVQYAPLKFSKILEMKSEAEHNLFITSTPTELELMDSPWKQDILGDNLDWAFNIYEMPRGSGIANPGRDSCKWDAGRVIYSRKMQQGEYINNGKVRGNTGTTGDISDIIAIDRNQYPKGLFKDGFFNRAAYMIQLCGGDVEKGVKIAYQQIAADSITQGHNGKNIPSKIYMPNAKLLRDMGVTILKDEKDPERIFMRLIPALQDRGCIYASQVRVPVEDLEMLVSQGYLIKDGKGYMPSKRVSDRV